MIYVVVVIMYNDSVPSRPHLYKRSLRTIRATHYELRVGVDNVSGASACHLGNQPRATDVVLHVVNST